MKTKTPESSDDLRPEYDFDFSKGERGRYYKRLLKEGSNNVVLEPDVAQAFPNSAAVNDALRAVIELVRSSTSLTRRPTGTRGKAPRAR
ncbi:MAG: hypothetical protein H7X91_00900 [Burkholderiales bacterium]|nr:hypothetical protein [Burkholderiales bacterium]